MHLNFSIKKKIIIIVFFYIFVSIIFCYKLIFFDFYFFNEDNRDLFFPNKIISQKIISNFEMPLWDKFRFSGESFLAEIQSQNFYPLYYIFNFLPVELQINYLTVFHFALSGFFMFFLIWKITGDFYVSILSGIMFMFTGMFGQALKDANYGIIATLCWMPAIIYCFLKLMEYKNLRYTSIFALTVSMQILAGHLQYVFYTHIILGLIFIYNMVFVKTEKISKFKYYCLSGILAFLIVSVQLLPTLQFAKTTPRAEGSSFRYSTGLSLKPDQILTFVFADFFGDREFNFFGASTTYYGGYCGIPVLIFALYFFILTNKKNKFIFLFILFFSFFLSLGKFNPLYAYILKLPGFGIFRAPTRALTIFSFALIFSAALGISEYLKLRRFFKIFFVIPLCSLIILLIVNIFKNGTINFIQLTYNKIYSLGYRSLWLNHFVKNSVPENCISIMSESLLFFFIISFAVILTMKMFSDKKNGKIYFFIILFFLTIADLWRVDWKLLSFSLNIKNEITAYSSFAEYIKNKETDISSYRVNAAYHIKYTWNTYYGFEDIFGRTATISSEYLDYLGNMKNGDNFFKLLNVKYLVQPEDLEIDSSVFRKCISENNNILYEFKNFLPRFTAVKRARFCNDKNEIYNIISNDTGFVPETEILFLNEDKSVCDNINSDMTLNSHINIIENNNNAIKLKIENSSPALILWSNKFSEDWQIFVNSQKTKMYRANWIFSCFKIPAGKNIVELKYSPVIYKISLLLTCAGLILSLLFLIFKF